MTDRDTSDIDREIGQAFHLLGRLFTMRADAAGRVAPTLPEVAFPAEDVGEREHARIAALYAEHGTKCETCGERQATHRGIDGDSMLRALCDSCPDISKPVGEMATSAGDDEPSSHPFAVPIPAAVPAVDDSFPWEAPSPSPMAAQDEARALWLHGTRGLDAIKVRAAELGRPLSAAEGFALLTPPRILTPAERDIEAASKPLPPTAPRTRKPAAPWEPSDTSWRRVSNGAHHEAVDASRALAAYLASCPTRHVKPGDRDFVRWCRARANAAQTDGLA